MKTQNDGPMMHTATPEQDEQDTKRGRFGKLARSPAIKRAGIGAAMLLVAATVSSLIMATAPDGEADVQTEKAWPVTVVRADPAELHPMFATYGRVEARIEAKLRTDIQAEVQEVFVQEGEWAEEGDLLISMRDEEIALRLREAKAEAEKESANLRATQLEYRMLKETTSHFEEMYRASQQTLERQRELAERRMIPQALLDNAVQQASRDTIEYQNHKRTLANFPSRISQNKAALTMATARAERAQLNLDKTKLRAPFSGPVLSVSVGPGDRTNLGVVLMTMADASSFEVRASIPNQYSDRIRQALASNQSITAEVAPENSSGAGVGAGVAAPQLQLSRIAHNVRPGQSGLDAWFRAVPEEVDPAARPDNRLTLGRVLNLNAVLPSEPNLIALPGQAVYNNSRVYLVQNNRLQAATVQRIGEIKLATGDYQVLVRGDNLSAGSDVMTTALPKAITGLLVDPIRPPDEETIVTAPQSNAPHSPSASGADAPGHPLRLAQESTA